ncbi:MAG: hypothetical protein K8S87_06160 [Planctomycetes bacterium]|nr:hypothetical protein [Planctomycetota bacterium]
MNRAKLILSLAINEKVIQSKQAANLLVDFAIMRKTNPALQFEDHLVSKQQFSVAQISNILSLFNKMRISCKNCHTKVNIANMPSVGNWVCQTCQNNEFGLIKVKTIMPATDKPIAKNIPKTISDKSISQLYKSVPDNNDSPYMKKTSVTPAKQNVLETQPDDMAEPIMLSDEKTLESADDSRQTERMFLGKTVPDKYMIETDSFDVKDSSHDVMLISKDDVTIDSQDKVKFNNDDNEFTAESESQLIADKDSFTPADNAQTLLQARKSTEKLPSNSTGIANRTAISMNGQEVVHKGITPEGLE